MILLPDMFFQEMSPRDNPCQVLPFWLYVLAFVCVFLPRSGSQPPFFWLPFLSVNDMHCSSFSTSGVFVKCLMLL